MVSQSEVHRHVAQCLPLLPENLSVVLAGATSGIGQGLLEALIRYLRSPTFYVIGRSAQKFAEQRQKLERINPKARIEFLEAEFTLLEDVDRVCELIKEKEGDNVGGGKIDWIAASAGKVPLNGAEYTKEGLEACLTLSYYSRLRLIQNLLPLLRRASQPRILSVLNGGKEEKMREDDLGLRQTWSALASVAHTTTMTSLAFEYLVEQERGAGDGNSRITFLHAYPGWVRTENFAREKAPEGSSLAWRVALAMLRNVVVLLTSLWGTSLEESGERMAYLLCNEKYAPGAWRIGYLSDQAGPNKALEEYRAKNWGVRVWEHTTGIYKEILGSKDATKL